MRRLLRTTNSNDDYNNDGGKNGTTSVENGRIGYDNEKNLLKKSTISFNNRYKRIQDKNNSAIEYE